MIQTKRKIYLGSKSPRRQSLLQELVSDFEVFALDVDESFEESDVLSEIPEMLAIRKNKAIRSALDENESILITADSVVIVDDQILNKPADYVEAIEMLSLMSGREHDVVTGCAISYDDKIISFSELTKVYFNEMDKASMDYYIKTCNPFDKAGSYGIQEWIGYSHISKIEGTYTNVMGLPTHAIYEILRSIQ